MRMRTWFIFDVNCDCGAYLATRSRMPAGRFPRCDYCRRPLGDMQWRFRVRVRARTRLQALIQARHFTEQGEGCKK